VGPSRPYRCGGERVNAFITVLREQALDAACRSIKGLLGGVPFTIKDSFDTAGVRTTRGSVFVRRPGTGGRRDRSGAAACRRRDSVGVAGVRQLGRVQTPTNRPATGGSLRHAWSIGRVPLEDATPRRA
jgi:hypothetical protein